MKEFNLNCYIKVKLTDLGKEIYFHQYDKLNEFYDKEIIKPSYPELDENGYYKGQAWQIFNLFGPYIDIGVNELPFHPNIIIVNDEDLKEVNYEKNN